MHNRLFQVLSLGALCLSGGANAQFAPTGYVTLKNALNEWCSSNPPYSGIAGGADIADWNTAGMTSFRELFQDSSCNPNITAWNTASVTTMLYAFQRASAFNQPIGVWNTARVRTMWRTFNSAVAFNQPLNDWNTWSTTDMDKMFLSASSFNQPLHSWNTANSGFFDIMFDGTANKAAIASSTYGWSTVRDGGDDYGFAPACLPNARYIGPSSSTPTQRCRCENGLNPLDNCGFPWAPGFQLPLPFCQVTLPCLWYFSPGTCTVNSVDGSCDDCSDFGLDEDVLNGNVQMYSILIPDETFDFLDLETVSVVAFMPVGHGNTISLECNTTNNVYGATNTDGVPKTILSSDDATACSSYAEFINFTMDVAEFSVNQIELPNGGFETVYRPTCRLVDEASGIIIASIEKVFRVTMDDDLAITVESDVLEETINEVEVAQKIDELVKAVMTPPIFEDGKVIELLYDLEALNSDAEGVFEIVSIDSLTVDLSGGASFDCLSADVALPQQIETETGYKASFLLPTSAYILNTNQIVTISAEVTIGLTNGGLTRRSVLITRRFDPNFHNGDSLLITSSSMAAGLIDTDDEGTGSASGASTVAPVFAGVFTVLMASAFIM